MKKQLLLILIAWISINAFGQTPNFECKGFASMNDATTGGKGGESVTVTNIDQLKKYVSEKDATPRIIYVKGNIEGANGGELIAIGSNKSIIGVASEGKISKVQFYLKNSKNIIIQNLFFTMENSTLGSDADCISIATTGSSKCQNIWIDHCEFDNNLSPIANPSASEKDKYDGMIDIKKSSEYITISWCKFRNHYKSILVGYTSTDTYDRKITIHHNEFSNLSSRTPSYRGGTGHIYNNYWVGCKEEATGKYFSTGINSREEACLFVESNYFKDMGKTLYCALDDVDKEGYASYKNNVFENSPEESITTCNTFTPPYTTIIDDAKNIPQLVSSYAGVGIIEMPANIPDLEKDDQQTTELAVPYLNNPTEIHSTGFEISWNAIDGANEYIVTLLSESDQTSNAPVFNESFDQLTAEVTKYALTSGKTDNPQEKYNPTGGASNMLCEVDGTMNLNGGRFSIKDLNLSGNPVLELNCRYISGTGKLSICVDYEGTSATTAVYNKPASEIGNTLTKLSIPLTGGTSTSYIQIRTESNTIIQIDNILVVSDMSLPSMTEETFVVLAPANNIKFSDLKSNIEYQVSVKAKDETTTSNQSNIVYVTPTNNTTTIVADQTDNRPDMQLINKCIIIKNIQKEENIRIYDIQGRIIQQIVLQKGEEFISKKLDSGIYVIHMQNKSEKIIVK